MGYNFLHQHQTREYIERNPFTDGITAVMMRTGEELQLITYNTNGFIQGNVY